MSKQRSAAFLSEEKVRSLAALADQARQTLSRFASQEVAFSAEGVQLLDEWIDDYLEATPDPPVHVRLLWTSFLGEMFRRCHGCWWALRSGSLVIVCPRDGGDWLIVAVREQIDRRIARGMSESLTYFHSMAGIELKLAEGRLPRDE